MSDYSSPTLLVVEDSDDDFAALGRIIDRSCDIHIPIIRCNDGDDALDFLHREGAYTQGQPSTMPEVILLDLNLPGTDGREVLQQIKQDEQLKTIPVVVMTSSSNPQDIDDCYQAGANSYILKPTNIEKFKASIQAFIHYWFAVAILPIRL
ncbi:response regulator [Leptolyngbya cf. ectocarpi LEGE 11479]|uniref:Response regulator n=1 Tax=Leptolyngbya cf. ectocarpi LEGE 11479 TaxID=1828722 RepID=A0A928X414_LEPEC|nr:response regulator [Leptolyngbya ectocarpi]MBE9067204.1 response regulator [Leptolyngbya cf. ectocarpi LEGE 11479]